MTNQNCSICHGRVKIIQNNLFDDRYGAKGKHNILVCTNCGFGQTKPGIPRNKIGEFYAKHYPISNYTKENVVNSVKTPSKFKDWLSGTNNISHHSTKSGEKVLDIGSASGVSLLEINQLGGISYGVEPDPSAQKLAKALGLKVHQGFITDNPFPNQKFNLVTASQVIEHEPDPLDFLISIKCKLKPDGRAVLSFPNLNTPYRYVFGRRWLHWHVPYHLNFFTRKSFSLLAKQAGFRIVKTKTITPNIWTMLQLRMFMTNPIEGTPNSIWQTRSSQSDLSHKSILSRFSYPLSLIASTFIIPINRILDFLGWGESFLVELQSE